MRSFSDAVSHVIIQLLAWTCVLSGGLHRDTRGVAAGSRDSSDQVVLARCGLHKLSVAIPWQC